MLPHNKGQQQHSREINRTSQQPTNRSNPGSSAAMMGGNHHTTFVPPQSVSGVYIAQQPQQPVLQHHEIPTGGAIYYNQPVPVRAPTPTGAIALAQQQQQQSMANRNRKLQVDDALSYLERVRAQFAQTPEKYNEFLEVMKSFKSHSIDTHGVILRVGELFCLYPDLINGFNTFLPPGFEVHFNEADNSIQINEPNATYRLINNSAGQQVLDQQQLSSVAQFAQQLCVKLGSPPTESQAGNSGDIQSNVVLQANTSSSKMAIIQSPKPAQEVLNSAETVQHPRKAKETRTQQMMTSATQQQQLEVVDSNEQQHAQKPIQFNQALDYLNKIKERFANNQKVYHQFLAILSNYQKADGSQKLNESDVYQEVAKLFHNEPDLMRDFKSFLPDANFADQQTEPLGQQLDPRKHAESASRAGNSGLGVPAGQPNTSAASAPNKKRPGVANEQVASKKAKGQNTIANTNEMATTNVNELLDDIPLKDFVFFEKVQRALQCETVFKNFIRFLSLYTNSIISKSELLDVITPFLAGTPQLLKEFKDILGGDKEINREPRKQVPLEERLPSEKAHQIDFTHSKQLGVSYRSLPPDYEQLRCSGRTELCNQVLNDKWVCYPTWSSEDTSVTSKKSSFEEVMCRTEDERFEVDILIETMSAARRALEDAKKIILPMTKEDAQKWMRENENKLHCSYSVLSRAVRKLYGEHTNKFLMALKENPLEAVPLILKRISDKENEWKTTREEYNVIWRDQVEKNYMKSLDYQAATFKANDVKNIKSRGLIASLEQIYEEYREKIESGNPPEFTHHALISYPGEKRQQIFQDANELILHYVRNHLHLPSKDKKGIDEILRSLIPKLFLLQMAPTIPSEQPKDTEGENPGKDNNGDAETEQRPRRGRKKQSDTSVKDADKIQEAESQKMEAQSSSTHHQPSPQLNYTLFFASNSWLLFIRLHALLCERLSIIQKRTDELVEEYEEELKFHERQREAFEKFGNTPEAHELNAVDVRLGLRDLKKPLQNPENFYQIMLQEMKNLLDDTVEMANFEETLRTMFGTKAYILFTMNKLVAQIGIHLKSFFSDSNYPNCMKHFEQYYAKRLDGHESGECARLADQEYEEAAEKLFLNEKCYKMFYLNQVNPIVSVELVDTNEPESDSDEEQEQLEESKNVGSLPHWDEFLKANQVNTDGLPNQSKTGIFMRRNTRYRQIMAQRLGNIDAQNMAEENEKGKARKKCYQFYASDRFFSLFNEDKPHQALLMGRDFEGEQSEVLVRKGAPAGRKGHRKVVTIRRKRWAALWENRLKDNAISARWLTTGTNTRVDKNQRFKYLKYTIYSTQTQ